VEFPSTEIWQTMTRFATSHFLFSSATNTTSPNLAHFCGSGMSTYNSIFDTSSQILKLLEKMFYISEPPPCETQEAFLYLFLVISSSELVVRDLSSDVRHPNFIT
jgi:hypothetical protein